MSDAAMPPDATPPVRTLLVSNDFLPQVGGIQQYTDNLLRRLPDAAAFVSAHPDAASHDPGLPYPVVRGPSRYMLPTRATERALRAAIEATRADVLLFATPWPLVSLGHRIGIPTAVCTHGAELVMPSQLPAVRAGLGRVLRRAELLFAVSDHTAEHMRRMVGPEGPPIRLLRTGVPLDRFHPSADGGPIRARHGIGPDEPVIVCVGRLVARKGQDVLVEALSRVRERVPGARLLLVGEGPLRAAIERAARRLPDGAVLLAGRVPWDELPAYHAAADVFAHPNRSRWFGLETEGFGVIFLEAQACGRPVVAGRSGGAPEALLPGETGLLVDGDDVDDVARALVELLGDPQRARRMGERGRAFVERSFDWEVIVAGLHADLAELAVGRVPEAQR